MLKTSDKRERLLSAASDLIHRQGFSRTTLAEIAAVADVPLGNVYYYFKSKDELGQAVISARRDAFRSQFAAWEASTDPRARLEAMLDMIDAYADEIAEHGCPVGSLCQELDKARDSLSQEADRLVREQLDWVTRQFESLGEEQAVVRAQDFVARLHGGGLLAHALNDAAVLRNILEVLRSGIRAA